jgi:hypothetical protein
MSTSLAVAQAYCANYQDGSCSGIDFDAKGGLFRFRPEGCKCLLSSRERCGYFETAVIPIDPTEWKSPIKIQEFKSGIDQYKRRHIAGIVTRARYCPDCQAPIGPRKRYCADCADKRQKEAARLGMQNLRKNF